jgi:hypothetical protein
MPSSIIHLQQDRSGQLIGQVVAGFYDQRSTPPDQTCGRCGTHTTEGTYGIGKNQNILGSYSVWGFSKKQPTIWKNGKVIRVKTGSVYRADLRLASVDELHLKVKYGFFYQTLTWERVPDKAYTQLCQGQMGSITNSPDIRVLCITNETNPTV